jgi:haloacid dehalogenase superfamily, subfamily IA, variant 3 with third motif having DD or ED/haloacid dehalogenase superfamily, subfamily IA, variant 1 with third motif having Dx(3-4)D or Dx(3-4)E
MGTEHLTETLADIEGVLFDFDGPLCDVFAGRPAPQVAKELTELAVSREPALADRLHATDDPIEVLRLAHAASTDLGHEVECALTAAEVEAVAVAGAPTPGGVAALEAARAAGRRVAVVSNNSAECVRAYLDQHGLAGYVLEVVGRAGHQPDLMKPNPHSLITAAEKLGVDVTRCVLIGDSLTDIQAAHAIGAFAIGYANKDHKLKLFTEAGADSVTDTMQSIADAMKPA